MRTKIRIFLSVLVHGCSHGRTGDINRRSNFIHIDLYAEKLYAYFVKPNGVKHTSKG